MLAIGKWVVDFLFARLDYDADGVLGCLYDIGASAEVLRKADKIMEEDRLNCGFTFTNPKMKRAVVVIGPSSSGDEFLNTMTHEIHHLAVAIADSLGVDLEGETPAYLIGDTVFALAKTICEFGCPRCRD